MADDTISKTTKCPHARGGKAMPPTVAEAVQILIDELPLREKVALADASTDAVGELTISLGNYIRNAFGLASENQALLRSCSKEAGLRIDHPDDASAIIIASLVLELVQTHKLRPV